jgi:hypothetical protein
MANTGWWVRECGAWFVCEFETKFTKEGLEDSYRHGVTESPLNTSGLVSL